MNSFIQNHKSLIIYCSLTGMEKIVCSKCKKVYEVTNFQKCPFCGTTAPFIYNFKNSDDYFKSAVSEIYAKRNAVGLVGLVRG